MRGIAVASLWILVLAACGGESADPTTTLIDTDANTTEVGTTTTTRATTTTTESTTTTSLATSRGGDSCLTGVWQLNSEAFMENLTTAFAAEADLQNVTAEFVGGSYTVTLAESGEYSGVRDDWAFQVGSPEGTFRLTIDGMDEGVWSADGPTLAISEVESSATITAQAVVDGEVFDLPTGTAPTVEGNAVAESSSYQCTDSSLTVTVEQGFVSEFTRVDG